MRNYIEITSLPIKRDFTDIFSPAAFLAARVEKQDESIELRIQNEKGKIHCYIGIDNYDRALQLSILLQELGCGFKPLSRSFGVEGIVLIRNAYENYNSIPNQNIGRSLIINELSTTNEKIKSLFYTLSKMEDGCGYSVFIKRTPKLDIRTTTYLKSIIEQNEITTSGLFSKLFYSTNLFEACIYVFSKEQKNYSFLKSELQFAFPGIKDICTTPISPKEIWNHLHAYRPPFACGSTQILYTFLLPEIQALTSLEGLNSIENGLSVNPDSLFPKQKNILPVGREYISLGYNKESKEQKLPLLYLRQHMFISGAPGTGKGNLIFSITEQLYGLHVPVLLIESAKQEQHHLRKKIPQLQVWRPKGGEYLLNPFSLPPGITMGDYKSSLIQMLRTCFKGGGSDSSLDELYATTLNICLSKYGFTETSTNTSPNITPFGLSEFIMEYIQLLEKNGYSDRVRNDMRTAGVTRLRNLFDINPDVFDTVNSVPVSELVNGYNLLQLNSLTTIESKQLFATILLISLGAWLRLKSNASNNLQLVVIMDESHNLLKGVDNNGTAYSFAEDFQNLLLEMRSIGVSFIIADQSASNIPKLISEACATKVFLGPSRFSGIEMFADDLKADEETLNNLYILKPGEGIWNTYGMSSGAFFKSPNIIEGYNVNKSYPVKNSYIDDHKVFFCQSFGECSQCYSRLNCNIQVKQKARRTSNALVSMYKQTLEKSLRERFLVSSPAIYNQMSKEDAEKRISLAKVSLDNVMGRIADSIINSPDNGNPYCCAIQFVRYFNREVTLPIIKQFFDHFICIVSSKLNNSSSNNHTTI